MQKSYLIRGGTVIDGTGTPPFVGDVRVKDGFIAEIGRNLSRHDRERVVDASGCYVTPGFIETHNHFDGPMWWMPTMEPMPAYGVTTSINGNCGFTAAPMWLTMMNGVTTYDHGSFTGNFPGEHIVPGVQEDSPLEQAAE